MYAKCVVNLLYIFSFCDDSIVNHVINTLLLNLVILQQIPQGQTQIHIPELRQFL